MMLEILYMKIEIWKITFEMWKLTIEIEEGSNSVLLQCPRWPLPRKGNPLPMNRRNDRTLSPPLTPRVREYPTHKVGPSSRPYVKTTHHNHQPPPSPATTITKHNHPPSPSTTTTHCHHPPVPTKSRRPTNVKMSHCLMFHILIPHFGPDSRTLIWNQILWAKWSGFGLDFAQKSGFSTLIP